VEGYLPRTKVTQARAGFGERILITGAGFMMSARL
jgi:hypothetical protein